MICAYIDKASGVVLNLIIASPTDPVPEDIILIEVPEGTSVSLGWVWNGSIFINPEAPV
jgi:hypothetical protein